MTSLSTVRVDRMEARTVEVYVWRHGAYVLRGRWGPGEAASSELLPGF
ncbi:MAG: hypothetical protein NZ572_06155 [Thermoflexus sp.]|nr:hypothetical protein [Thermoflexus sp.]